jgi:putative serine protease PepD
MTESTPADQPRPDEPNEPASPSDSVDRPTSGSPQDSALASPYPAPGYAAPSYPPPSYPGSSYSSSAYPVPGYGSGGYQGSSGYGAHHTDPLPAYAPYAGESGSPAPAPSTKKSRPTRMILLAAVIAALVGGGVGAVTVAAFDDNGTSTNSVSLSTTSASAPVSAKTDGTIAGAAAKIQPSVVTISVTGSQESGTGTGVIIRSDGYILTNNHVVSVASNGGSISVLTDSGQQASAKVVGVDASDDLAVVKVDGLPNLTAATFAKSSSLVVGQSVVAVGAPLGLSNTVTSGIVSNTARPVRAGDNNEAVFNAVQTDAAINPGNSGGPLVDLNGNVVGINAAIATASSGGLQIPGQTQQSGSIGIGFAIPSDEASRIAGELIANGKATHAVIGVEVVGTNGQSGSSASSTIGATLGTVQSGGPAAEAGLKAGDVITAVDQQRIEDADGLIAAIRSHAPDQKVTLTYVRAGKTSTAQVTLGSSTS